jgi:DNA-binding transcriptional regulator LsrR (DeoR family)
MANTDELRLMTRVARLYYERGLRQTEISGQLNLSQTTVSRLLARAREVGIVRISVNVPGGVYPELEEALIERFGLKDALVADCWDDDERLIQREIGAAAAYYLETTVKDGEIVGISSWSETLLALVDALHQVPAKTGVRVVQILGGIGNPAAEIHANRLTGRLAKLLNGTAVFLPAPGILGSAATFQVLATDPYVREALNLFDQVTLALVGIGASEPSKLLAASGNVFSGQELAELRAHGQVAGDILLHFFDENGVPVKGELDRRVVSMQLEQLKRVERSVGVAGGERKHLAILGALRGRLINVLITDRASAEKLLE